MSGHPELETETETDGDLAWSGAQDKCAHNYPLNALSHADKCVCVCVCIADAATLAKATCLWAWHWGTEAANAPRQTEQTRRHLIQFLFELKETTRAAGEGTGRVGDLKARSMS